MKYKFFDITNDQIIESPRVDFRKNPNMKYAVLDLMNDLLFETKLNKKFLEEGFY